MYGIDRAVTVAVANFKGGVAKTFTAVTLAILRPPRVSDTDDRYGSAGQSMPTTFGLSPASVDDLEDDSPLPLRQEVRRAIRTRMAEIVCRINRQDLLEWSGYRRGQKCDCTPANSSCNCADRMMSASTSISQSARRHRGRAERLRHHRHRQPPCPFAFDGCGSLGRCPHSPHPGRHAGFGVGSSLHKARNRDPGRG